MSARELTSTSDLLRDPRSGKVFGIPLGDLGLFSSLLIAVAGARNAGISMVVRLFADWSGTAVPVRENEESR